MLSNFAHNLRHKKLLKGMVLSTACAEFLEILKSTNNDWFFIDMEHSSLDLQDLRLMLQILQPANKYCIARIADDQETTLKKTLDLGVDGIIVPQVKNALQLQRIVKHAKYTPQGERAVGIYRAHAYGEKFQEYLKAANESVAIIALIESIEGVNNIDEIAAVEGVDALYVGPYDLSASLNVPGQFEDERLIQAIKTIETAALNKNKALGAYLPKLSDTQDYIQRGYSLLAHGVDTNIFLKAVKELN